MAKKKPSEYELVLANAKAAKARAQALREQAAQEEAEADEFLRLYEKFAPKDEVQAARAVEIDQMSTHEVTDRLAAAIGATEPPLTPTSVIQEAARVYLRQTGRPASIKSIYDALVFQGIRIGGRKPMMNLSSKLSTSKDMRFTKDVGWWFITPEPSQGGAL